MSSGLDAASEALSTGIIVAIVVGSLTGVAVLIFIIIVSYCLCCKKSKSYPGAILPQQPPYPGTVSYVQPMNQA